MSRIRLLLAALVPVATLAAGPVLTTDFDSMTAGAVDAATMSTATPGGSWSFNTGRGATFVIQNDGTSDQAFLVDDTNGGNSGTQEFFTVTLDSPLDLTTDGAEISFRTAAARAGTNKALRFDLLDSSDTVLAQVQWANNNEVKLNGTKIGNAAFTYHNPWDSVAGVTHDVSISLGGGTTELTFNALNGTSPFQNSVTELAKIRVYSVFNASGSRGVIMDDLSVDQVLATDPPVIDSFTVHPDSILGDREVLFTWETTRADSVIIDQGVGSVSLDGEDYFAVSAASLPVTFTLTATNSLATPPNDVVTAQVIVTARPGVTEAPALMACWPFDGNVTETIFGATTTLEIGPDEFDDITFVADVPAAIAGRRTQSLLFGADRNQFGSDDFLTAEFSGVGGITPRSISCWVKRATPPPEDGTGTIFSYGTNATGRAFVSSLNASAQIQNAYRQSGNVVTPVDSFPYDQWVHVAIVYAGIDGDILRNTSIYINGTRHNRLGFFSGGQVNTLANAIEFGRDQTDGTQDFAAGMNLSEFTFYRGELTGAQVAALAAGTDPKNLDGPPTPTIPNPATALATSPAIDPQSGSFDMLFTARQGTIFELQKSTDLQFWSTINANVIGTGSEIALSPAVDPVTEPAAFFRLEQK